MTDQRHRCLLAPTSTEAPARSPLPGRLSLDTQTPEATRGEDGCALGAGALGTAASCRHGRQSRESPERPREMPGGSRWVWPLLALSPHLERGQEWGCQPQMLQRLLRCTPRPYPGLIGRQNRTRQGCHCPGRGSSHPQLRQGSLWSRMRVVTNASARSGSGPRTIKPGPWRNPIVRNRGTDRRMRCTHTTTRYSVIKRTK